MSKSIYLHESHRLIDQLLITSCYSNSLNKIRCMSHTVHPSLTEHIVGT